MTKKKNRNSNPAKQLGLFQSLIQRTKEEKSNYAKLIFQENLISLLIVATLHSVSQNINKMFVLKESSKDGSGKLERLFWVEFTDNMFEKKTLGHIVAMIRPYLANEDKLREDLKNFVTKRNNLTHNILDAYESLFDVEKDSKEIVVIGERAIKELNNFRSRLHKDFIKKISA